jgi:hypothetical protein
LIIPVYDSPKYLTYEFVPFEEVVTLQPPFPYKNIN